MADQPLRVLILGAHPDDCDASAGGVAVMYARRGHTVRLVSLTNGDAGHYAIGGVELARRRYAETQAAARVAGVEYQVFDIHDGELVASLENRRRVIGLIREFVPDLVLAHQHDEYHPDHRAVGVLAADASYLVGVPNICPLVPHMMQPPVFAHFATSPKSVPNPEDLVVVDIDEAIETKWDMLHCHESQIYEWLPYNEGMLAQVPEGDAARRRWLAETWGASESLAAERYRSQLVTRYGQERGAHTRFVEAFVASQYGTPLSTVGRDKLFPF